jgi:hypothetical protein
MRRLVLLWVLSLVIVATGTFAFAQARLNQPVLLSGADVGFRVEGTGFNGRPVGTWMVRYNGQWTEVAEGGIRPLTK